MEIWNEWSKEVYSIEEIKSSFDIALKVGEMGWPTIKEIHDRMKLHGIDKISRWKMSESERECVEKAMFYMAESIDWGGDCRAAQH